MNLKNLSKRQGNFSLFNIKRVVFVCVVLFCAVGAFGASYMWTGSGGNTNWDNVGNWTIPDGSGGTTTPSVAPSNGDSVRIPTVLTDYPELTAGVDLGTTGSITIAGGASLSTSTFALTAATITAEVGTVTINGTGALTVTTLTANGALTIADTRALTATTINGEGSLNAEKVTLTIPAGVNATLSTTGGITVASLSAGDAASGTITVSTNITSPGSLIFHADVQFGAENITLTSTDDTAGSGIALGNPVSGTNTNLTLKSNQQVRLWDDISLKRLSVTAPEEIRLEVTNPDDTITTTESQTYKGPVTLYGNRNISSVGTVEFTNTINCESGQAYSLSIYGSNSTTPAGNVTFGGLIGNITPLNALNINADTSFTSGGTNDNPAIIATSISFAKETQAITSPRLFFQGALIKNTTGTLTFDNGFRQKETTGTANDIQGTLTAAAGDIRINNTSGTTLSGATTITASSGNIVLDGTYTGAFALNLSASAAVSFNDFSLPTASSEVDITSASNVNFNGNFSATALTFTDADVNLAFTPDGAAQTIAIPVDTFKDVTGTIDINATDTYSLTFTNGFTQNNTTFGTVELQGAIESGAALSFSGATTLTGDTTITATNQNVTFGSTVKNGMSSGNASLEIDAGLTTGTGTITHKDGIGASASSGNDEEKPGSITLSAKSIVLKGAGVRTIGSHSYTGEVTLSPAVPGDGGSGGVRFNSLSGDITFNNAVTSTNVSTFALLADGTITLKASVSDIGYFLAYTPIILNGATISSTNYQTYSSTVTLGVDNTLTSENSYITFSSSVTGAQTLNLEAGSYITFNGSVGEVGTLLTKVDIQDATIVNINRNFYADALTFTDTTSHISFNPTATQTITVPNTADNGFTTVGGNVTINTFYTPSSPAGSPETELTTTFTNGFTQKTGGGTVSLAGTVIAGANGLSFSGATILTRDTTLNAGAQTITLTGTINSEGSETNSLTLGDSAEVTTVNLNSAIGEAQELSNLSINADAINISSATITTTGNQDYGTTGAGDGNVVLNADTTTLGAGAGSVAFKGSISSNADAATEALTVQAGNISFNNNTGGAQSSSITGAVQLNTTGEASFGNAAGDSATFGSLTFITNNPSKISLAGNLSTDSGEINFPSAVELDANSTVASNNGVINFNGAVTDSGTSTFGVSTVSGNITFNGASGNQTTDINGAVTLNSTGTVIFGNHEADSTSFGSLTFASTPAVTLAGTLATGSEAITFPAAVTLAQNSSVTSTDANITFTGNVTGTSLDLTVDAGTQTVSFSENVGTVSNPVDTVTVIANTTTFTGSLTSASLNITSSTINLNERTGAQTATVSGAVILATYTPPDTPAGTISFGNDEDDQISFGSFVITTGTLNLAGTISTTLAAGQVYNCNVILLAPTILQARNSGVVTFNGTVNSEDSETNSLTIHGADDTESAGAIKFGNGTGDTVGATGKLSSLSVSSSGITINGGAVYTTGAQTYTGETTIGTTAATLQADTGNIAFSTDVMIAAEASFTASAGKITYGGRLEYVSPGVYNVSIVSNHATEATSFSGRVSVGELSVTSAAGGVAFYDTVALGGNSSITATGGNVSFSNTISETAASALEITANTITINGGAVTTSGNQTYGATSGGAGNVVLGKNTTFTAGNAATIAFKGTVDGVAGGSTEFLTVSGASIATFGGAVSNVSSVNVTAATINVSGGGVTSSAGQAYSGTTAININATTGNSTFTASTGDISFTGPITLNEETTITAVAQDILFKSTTTTIRGAQTLNLDAGRNIGFDGNVGASGTPLTKVDIQDASTVNINADFYATTLAFTDRSPTVSFTPTAAQTIDVPANSFTSNTGLIDINATNSTTFAKGLSSTGSGAVNIEGIIVSTTGGLNISGATTLTGDSTLNANSQSVTLAGTVNSEGSENNSLTICEAASASAVEITGAVGNSSNVGDITVNSNSTIIFRDQIGTSTYRVGNIDLNATTSTQLTGAVYATNLDVARALTNIYSSIINTTGNQNYGTGSVILNENISLNASGASAEITFGGTVNGDSDISDTEILTISDAATVTFGDVVGATPLTALSVTSSNIEINGNITTNGSLAASPNNGQYYSGAVVLGNDITFTSTNKPIEFDGAVNGAHDLVIEAGTSTVSFDGGVGTDTAAVPTGLIANATTITLGANGVTTNGSQDYNGDVESNTATKIAAETVKNISFSNNVNINGDLSLICRELIFDGSTNQTFDADNEVAFSGLIKKEAEHILTITKGFYQTGDFTNQINGTIETSSGRILFGGSVQLVGNTTLDTGMATLQFGRPVNASSSGGQSLTITNANPANINNLVGDTYPLSSLSMNATTIALNGGSVTTTGNQTYGSGASVGNVSIGQSTTLTARNATTNDATISFKNDVTGAYLLSIDSDRSSFNITTRSVNSPIVFIGDSMTVTYGTHNADIYIDLNPSETLTLGGALQSNNLYFYNGALDLDGNDITTGNFAIFGTGYDATDYGWHNANTRFAYFGYDSLLYKANNLVNATASFADLGTSTIDVSGNFYNNGASMTSSTGPWFLEINPSNNPISNNTDTVTATQWGTRYAVAFNMMVQNSTASGGWVAAAAGKEGQNVVHSGTNSQWQAESPTLTDVYVTTDSTLNFGFTLPGDGTNAENVRVSGSNNLALFNDRDSSFSSISKSGNTITATAATADAWNTDTVGTTVNAQSTDGSGKEKAIGLEDSDTYITNDVSIMKGAFYHMEGNTMSRSIGYGVQSGAATTPDPTYTDQARPVLSAVYTGQEVHNPFSTQMPYDAHNFIELRYSEPVTFGDAALDATSNNVNIRASDAYGHIENSDSRLTVTGFIEVNGKLNTGNFDESTNEYVNALYRNFNFDGGSSNPFQTHRVRISIAGYTDGTKTVTGINSNNYPGFIESATTPTGAVSIVANSNIKDAASNVLNHENAFKPTIQPSGADLYSPWDTSPPSLARVAWDVTSEYEILGIPNAAGTAIDRFEIHFHDNAYTYNSATPEEEQWTNATGWGKNNPQIRRDSVGGSRPNYATIEPAAPTTSGGLRVSSLEDITAAFSIIETTTGLPVIDGSFELGFARYITDDSFFAAGTQGRAGTNDTLYLTLNPNAIDLDPTLQYKLVYDNTTGYVTDLAGNRMPTLRPSSANLVAPLITLTVAPYTTGTQEIFLYFNKALDLDPLPEHTGRAPLAEMASKFTFYNSAGSVGAITAIDARVAFTTETSTGLILELEDPLSANDLFTVNLQVNDPAKTGDNAIFGINGARVSSTGRFPVTYFGVNTVYPINAVGSLDLIDDGSTGDVTITKGNFDGSKGLYAHRDITINVHVENGIPPLNDASSDNYPKLYLDSNANPITYTERYKEETGQNITFWMPTYTPPADVFSDTFNQNTTLIEPDEKDPGESSYTFTIGVDDIARSSGDTMQFLFEMGKIRTSVDGILSADANTPLYHINIPEITDLQNFSMFAFKVFDETQAGGSTILNNVINVNNREEVLLEVIMPKAGNLNVTVLTADGNIVKTLSRGRKAAGNHYFTWDGTNNAGNAVARGIYFVRIVGPGIDETRKVMAVKD